MMTEHGKLAQRMVEIAARDDTTGLAADALREGSERIIALASGTEAGTAETTKIGSVHEGPTAESGDAHNLSGRNPE